MPFRGSEDPGSEFLADPLERFFALEAALDQNRSLFGDRVPLRFIAVNLVLTPGEPAELAGRVIALREGLDAHMSWLSQVESSVRMLIASSLLKLGDSPADFYEEVQRVRATMSALGLRRSEIYQTLTILALRSRNRLRPIERDQVERVQEIYEAMKTHHWLLTGPEDLPACAFLSFLPGTAAELGQRAADIYQVLNQEAGLWKGDPLQTASNVLALGQLEAAEIAGRFRRLAQAFRDAGVRVGQTSYDEVALLCFLARPVERIVETVIEYRDRIGAELGWAEKSLAFGLGANLAFVRLVGNDPELGPLADAKSLLDMQSIVDARAAAAGAAGAA